VDECQPLHEVLPAGEVKAMVCEGIMSQHVAPHLRLLLARPGECLVALERTVAVLPRGWMAGRGLHSSTFQLNLSRF